MDDGGLSFRLLVFQVSFWFWTWDPGKLDLIVFFIFFYFLEGWRTFAINAPYVKFCLREANILTRL